MVIEKVIFTFSIAILHFQNGSISNGFTSLYSSNRHTSSGAMAPLSLPDLVATWSVLVQYINIAFLKALLLDLRINNVCLVSESSIIYHGSYRLCHGSSEKKSCCLSDVTTIVVPTVPNYSYIVPCEEISQ